MKYSIEAAIESIQELIGDTLPKDELKRSVRSITRHGDLCFTCHKLAKEMYGEAEDISQWLVENLEVDPELFEKVESIAGFANFHLNKQEFTRRVLTEINRYGQGYGNIDIGEAKYAVFDYSSPNIGKPLHIGHIRSTIIGDAVINILKKAGYNTHGINYLGDIGLHLGKVITSYRKHVDDEALQNNPAEELLRLYVLFGEEHEQYVNEHRQELTDKLMAAEEEDLEQIDSPLMQEAKDTLLKLEANDPETTAILERIHEASMESFDRVYNLLGLRFDETIGQSNFSDIGKKLVQEALDKGIAEYTPEGAVVVKKLSKHGLPPKVILRSDGTAIYSTQDLGAAQQRWDDYHFAKSIYVVAEEQGTYFRQVFKTLELLGREWAPQCHHLSFGMIHIADEKMSSRKGNVIFLEDVLDRSIELARDVVKDSSLTEEEKDTIARQVGIGAIKYMTLGVDPVKTIKFSWERALDLNANSSPYIQYSHARATSIVEGKHITEFNPKELSTNAEFELIKKMAEFPLHVQGAAETLKPNIIANYCYSLAKTFNRFYQKTKVLGTPQEQSRLYLLDCYRTVISNGLHLLGIEAPKKM